VTPLLLLLLLAASPTFDESFRNGLRALQKNDLSTAQTSLTAAAKLAPRNGRVWIALAQTYWKLNQSAKADDAAAKAEALGPEDSVVLGSLVIYYTESDRIPKAAEAQGALSSLQPQDTAARDKAEALYFEAAQPLLQHEKFSEAIAILTKGTARVKGSAQLELALGVAYYGMRRFEDAAGAFLRTIAIAPEIEKPYLFLGQFLDQIPDKLPEVTQQFIRYETANPASPTGYMLHAKALDTQSMNPDVAQALLQKAISLNDADPVSHFELGIVFERTQRYEESAREFERSAQLDPSDPATHYRLSRVYDRLGRTEAARAERELHGKMVEAQEAARNTAQ
jgi:tetratricopeptide (TPR) repeat protein